MLVTADWRPHVYTDSDLDQIEKRGSGTLEEFGALICREIRSMSEQEKAEFRRGWIQAYPSSEFRRSFGPQIGSTVTVQLFNGRQIRGTVKSIHETITGKKFQVSSGDITVRVEEKQILEWQ